MIKKTKGRFLPVLRVICTRLLLEGKAENMTLHFPYPNSGILNSAPQFMSAEIVHKGFELQAKLCIRAFFY